MFVSAIAYIWAFKTREWFIKKGKGYLLNTSENEGLILYSILRFGLD
jgi:hypothetical protein